MNVLAVVLALWAALANGAASVLQRRAAMEQAESEAVGGGPAVRQGMRALARLVRRRFWLAGVTVLGLSALLQAGALAVGSLSVVQPLMASELLFTLLLGTVVFHHRPGGRTWLSFLMLAAGLALFLAAVGPSAGEGTGMAGAWLPVGILAATAVLALLLVARTLTGAAGAAVLGCATAVSFACTAALIKEVTGRVPEGAAVVFTTGYVYALGCAGLLSLLLLQSALRAGTLAASQPALTLGDALVSVVLGKALFGERIALGDHLLPATLGACLVAAGTVGLSLSPAVAGHWDATRTTRRHGGADRLATAADDEGTEAR
ncbi:MULTISPECIES: DMT family transporter [unclassified Streptomyces]|uniref:DMT family transporter n=1 Tax=unclassified Streptomyces TaxID=2593676 RepID=UPI002254EF2E|nr:MULTISPECIES: DMT family transporter [unclassified Streptomyces]WSP53511.1 DMT family transporter [Streptomyces sp. NBC_01241]WSU25820.1 DMT family transporter [Streptomyces sp. NBC_01108]MCX4784890.1 DMT family transporter [Streptomyces sp. NBC_01221]MCX4799157.1 DMT family transporter [Streptomyces sp. NBC_01242]WSJ40347.1 DMT family transporter [Streptomyces sp. NBC_01321]